MNARIIAPALLLTIISCSNPPANQEPTAAPAESVKDTAAAEAIDEAKEFKFSMVLADIPSPLEIINVLGKSHAHFDKALTNGTGNESRYTTSFKRGLNFGVYAIDLGYLAANDQFGNIQSYYNTTKNLAGTLDATEGFNKVAASRIKSYAENKDSVMKVVDEFYTQVDQYLRNNQRLQTATQMLVGGWVESQYLTLNSLKGMDKGEDLNKIKEQIFMQKLHLGKIVSVLKDYEKDKEFMPIITEMNALNSLYQAIPSSAAIDEATLASLTEKVAAVRGKITN